MAVPRTRNVKRLGAVKPSSGQVSFESLISGLFARLLNVPDSPIDSEIEVDREVESALRRILDFFQLDRCELLGVATRQESMRITHACCAEGVERVSGDIEFAARFPWCHEKLVVQGEHVSFTRLADLPPAAAQDRQSWAAMGVRSCLMIPLFAGQAVRSLFVIQALRAERIWPEEHVARLRLLGEILVNALERKRTDSAARESEARFRVVADSAPVLIWMSDTDKLCNFFNKPWLEFTGRTAEQEMGNGWADGVHPDDLSACLKTYTESFDARQPFVVRYRLRRHDGEYHWFSDNGVPRYDAQGSFVGYIGCCVDIHEQRKDEEEMQRLRQQAWHADRVARTGAITASLAHELNQPLAAILSNTQAGLRFMASANPDLAQIREILGDIVFDSKRAAAVISGLRAMLRRQGNRRETVSLANTIQETIGLLHGELVGRHVEVEMRCESECTALADKAQIQQVLLNLVMNSVEAMDNHPSDQRRLELTLTLPRVDEAQIAVRDFGPGIPEEESAKLFDAFWTTKSQGLGIGLAICRSIIESHGGRIWFANNRDRGVTFYFTLPLSRGELSKTSNQ